MQLNKRQIIFLKIMGVILSLVSFCGYYNLLKLLGISHIIKVVSYSVIYATILCAFFVFRRCLVKPQQISLYNEISFVFCAVIVACGYIGFVNVQVAVYAFFITLTPVVMAFYITKDLKVLLLKNKVK